MIHDIVKDSFHQAHM